MTEPLAAAPSATGLLIGHGSPDPRHASALRRLTEAVDVALDRQGCALAFLDHDAPRLHEWLAARPDGDRVRAIGLLLTAGYHAQVDIPRELEAHSERLDLVDLGTLGMGVPSDAPATDDTKQTSCAEPWIFPVLEQLVAEAGGTPTSTVVLVAAGSAQDQARHDLRVSCGEWQLRRPGLVLAAAVSGPDPRPSDVIDAHRASAADALGSASDLFVVPLMLAPGALADRATSSAIDGGVRFTETITTVDRTPSELVASLAQRLAGRLPT